MADAKAVRAMLLDDNEDDREMFGRLSQYGLPCTAMAPPLLSAVEEEVVIPVNDGTYDLVLVDFLLDQESTDSAQSVTYRGSTPAALLKDRCPHVPVVLVTTEDRYREYIEQRTELSTLFDFVVSKREVRDRDGRRDVAEKLQDLALGFRKLRSVVEIQDAAARWERFGEALVATDEELHSLREAWPDALPGSASELARWLLKGLLKYPGPLRDGAETAVMMGLVRGAMVDSTIREWTSGVAYSGVFARVHERWWSSRLLEALEGALGESALNPSGERAAALARLIGLEEPQVARCNWCDEPNVHRICSVCGVAVDSTHHLEAKHAQRPTWALPAVVCFRCIETGEDEEVAVRYGPGTTDLVDELRSGQLGGR